MSDLSSDTDTRSHLPDLYEASISQLQDGLQKGHFTSVDLTKAYLARIEEVNLKGAALHAVIETNPNALSEAANLDSERRAKGSREPLHGIPLLLKDNIATLYEEGMNTTSGSYALLGSVVPRDAFVAAKLRKAGAIFIGKANMSEWASFRGKVPNGFSGRGGQTLCPYYPDGDASGSSSGSGVAMAIGLAAGSLGSETDGSIVFPSSRNNIVGIKPTIGLVSRCGVIPISSTQDTVGPMCRSVSDAALLLSFIAGQDEGDEATRSQPAEVPTYLNSCDTTALAGKRLGVPRKLMKQDEAVQEAFEEGLSVLRKLGAEVVDPADFPSADEVVTQKGDEHVVLTVEFKIGVNKYISELVEVPTGVRDLADVIEFNKAHADLELPPPYHQDQSQLIESQESQADERYEQAVAKDYEVGRTNGIDAALHNHNIDALVLPTHGSYASMLAAIAGYPIISVPLGFYPGTTEASPSPPTPIYKLAPDMPFGISFIGTAYSEATLIAIGYAYEQATQHRLKKKAIPQAIPMTQLKDVMA